MFDAKIRKGVCRKSSSLELFAEPHPAFVKQRYTFARVIQKAAANYITPLSGSQIEEKHTQQDKHQVERLAADILFLEEKGPGDEAHHDTAAAYHRDDRNHGVGVAEGIEIDKVGADEEERDEEYRGAPHERSGVFAMRVPQEQQHDGHHGHLVIGVPHLHGHAVEAVRHEVFVIQSAGGSRNGGQHDEEYPQVVAEIDSLFPTREGEHDERDDGQQHTYPLIEVEPFAEDEQRSHEGEYGLRRLDGPGDSDGQMFGGEIGTSPRGEYEGRLADDVEVFAQGRGRHIKERVVHQIGKPVGEYDAGEEQQAAKACVEKQHGNDGIAIERCLFTYFVAA